MTKRTAFHFVLATGLLLLTGFSIGNQSPRLQVKTERIVQFENDEVTLWRSIVVPHTPLPMHRHEHPRVIIALVGGTMKIIEQDGAQEAHDWHSDNAYWLPANLPGTLHSDVNAGARPIEVIVVELKGAQ